MPSAPIPSLDAFQESGACDLTFSPRRLLADEMRLGKSAQVVVAAKNLGARKVLVLCPAIARPGWIVEFDKWANRTAHAVNSAADTVEQNGVVVCSYDLATQPAIHAQLQAIQWHIVVLDEAHMLSKPAALRTSVAFGLAARAPFAWAVTGTPSPSSAADAWPLMYAFGWTTMPYDAFVAHYCVTRNTKFGVQIMGNRNVDELRAKLAPHVTRRKFATLFPDFPPLIFEPMPVEPGYVSPLFFADFQGGDDAALLSAVERESRKLRSALRHAKRDEMLAYLETIATSAGTATLRRYVGLQKVEPIVEAVRAELEAGTMKKVVIFAVHKHVCRLIRDLLREHGAVEVVGQTQPIWRERYIKRFAKSRKCKVFVGNIVAASVGIDLSVAKDIIVVEDDWSPVHVEQAVRRCTSKQNPHPVRVRFAYVAGTIDEKIRVARMRKTALAAAVFDPCS